MAEEKKEQKQKKPEVVDRAKKTDKSEKAEKPKRPQEAFDEHETLVRILSYDIPGSRNLYAGLTRIKGVSWAISNAVCLKLKFPRNKKVADLTKDEIKQIETFLRELPVYDFLKNRRTDVESGKTSHFYGTDLDMKRDFDIKRLREMKSYRGVRHALKQPVRGQRTRSHFRKAKKAMGVKKK